MFLIGKDEMVMDEICMGSVGRCSDMVMITSRWTLLTR